MRRGFHHKRIKSLSFCEICKDLNLVFESNLLGKEVSVQK
ncbi:hypothetical protein LEP1GSC199_3448 [Leptospira vanthielii serovar Holland str. Waz Holland = ATCC 700522]|uniref:Uncharacterized protein n=1 Tax=Leptospira vanthielii serovar Holland str. Waz Holland = ATCC 700522 TaxID=1218591 RepID=N1W7C0_9LEPT|nr:hypothetical protein LEP1GSC199_3448 [Leptospira vanthielii serovar Holland str. Waz Holland = ATCC 700522]